MRVLVLVVVLAACDQGERLAATHNGHAAAVARELDELRQLEVLMCGCRSLDCLGGTYERIQGWWDGLGSRLGPPLVDETELARAEAIGRSATVCFGRTQTQLFLRAAESYRLEMCDRGGTLDHIIDDMRAFADALERLPGEPWPRLVGDEHERAYASLTHFAWCAEAVAPGVQSRLPPVFRTWVSAPQPAPSPTIIY